MSPPRPRPWVPSEMEALRRLYPEYSVPEIAVTLDRSIPSVIGKAVSLGLSKSEAWKAENGGRLKSGRRPWNAGTPFDAGGASVGTRFAPGNRPHTWVPVGSLRISSDGALEKKISEEPGPYNVRWRPVARIVWEQTFGRVPSGHVVVFKPGMKTTLLNEITPDRLECIDRAQLAARNSVHRHGPEIARLSQLRGALNRQIRRIERQQDQQPSPATTAKRDTP